MTNNKLTIIAKNLRKQSTDAERKLWHHLRARQLQNLKFRRQAPMGNYILDFVCYENNLVIELDGGQHSIEHRKDEKRDNWLKKQGFKVLRFWNNEVLTNTTSVLEVIRKNCLSPAPNPSHQGRGMKEDNSTIRREKRKLTYQK